jgi:hypothetical protein
MVIEVETSVERDPLEEPPHVVEGVDRDADASHLARAIGCVRVVAHLRGQVERHGEPRLPALEQVVKRALVSSAVPKPAYWRMVQTRPRYMSGRRRA